MTALILPLAIIMNIINLKANLNEFTVMSHASMNTLLLPLNHCFSQLKMCGRRFLFLTVTVLLCVTGNKFVAADSKPHIVFVLVDDWDTANVAIIVIPQLNKWSLQTLTA